MSFISLQNISFRCLPRTIASFCNGSATKISDLSSAVRDKKTTNWNRKTANFQFSKVFRCDAFSNDRTNNQSVSSGTLTDKEKPKLDLKWSKATIIENKAASANGSVRLVVLSIEDHVDYLEGRKLKRIQKAPRWIDEFKNPGQFVSIRYGDVIEKFAIASSPSSSRTQSALLDATIIEIIVEKSSEGIGAILSEMGPGELIQVSQPLGKGFISLFSTESTLVTCLEESRPMILVCSSPSGFASIRSVLNWVPVMALTTKQSVILAYLEKNAMSAACIQEWDEWRDNGVKIFSLYETVEQNDERMRDPMDLLKQHLFSHSDGLQGVIGADPGNCCILLSGLSSSVSTPLSKLLMSEGVSQENLLFCQYF